MQNEHGGRLQARRGLGLERCGQGGNRQIWARWRVALEGIGLGGSRENTSNAACRASPTLSGASCRVRVHCRPSRAGKRRGREDACGYGRAAWEGIRAMGDQRGMVTVWRREGIRGRTRQDGGGMVAGRMAAVGLLRSRSRRGHGGGTRHGCGCRSCGWS
ncbi:hypothetical protein GUJ93_ZPchr0004g39051 [Zizania palustris]|uniref:Uncharacterized protein n=1 Tax=Zizania palustris TaxID=103762 RepID=A0A8J5S5V7_ZIZPA|nr:hypothetical protein GUJ93_ZPchr0004g39051 [Zizania palustris]